MDDPFIKKIQKTFSLYGLTISRKISKALADYLNRFVTNDNCDAELKTLIEHLMTQNLTSPNIDAELLRKAITEYHRSANSLRDEESIFNVIDMNTIPKVIFDVKKQKFVLTKVDLELLSEADNKPLVYKDRLNLVLYRTLQHETFQPLKLGEVNPNKRKLTHIEYLNSNTVSGSVTIMGMLSFITEGDIYLEDDTGYVKLDISETIFDSGLIVEGTIVICDGIYDENEIMKVENMCLPPPDNATNVQAIFSNANTFGGQSPTSLKLSDNLKSIELADEDGSIIFISDFMIDNAQVVNNFKIILDFYADAPPIAVVLCGHFLSTFLDYTSPNKLEERFKVIADMIATYPNIVEKTKFVLIPGPHDIGASKILPRASLPKHCLKYFISKVPNTILASNPCRIQYCTKEIVVIRENMLSKLCRNTIHFPGVDQIHEHFAQTIISQSHLTPFTLPMMPIYWKYDHILQLFPTPDLIVVADNFYTYETTFNGCHVVNPGSFPSNKFDFITYYPSRHEIELCDLTEKLDIS